MLRQWSPFLPIRNGDQEESVNSAFARLQKLVFTWNPLILFSVGVTAFSSTNLLKHMHGGFFYQGTKNLDGRLLSYFLFFKNVVIHRTVCTVNYL